MDLSGCKNGVHAKLLWWSSTSAQTRYKVWKSVPRAFSISYNYMEPFTLHQGIRDTKMKLCAIVSLFPEKTSFLALGMG